RQVVEWVDPNAILYTDEWPAYNPLGRHFAAHGRIHHGGVSTIHSYVDGDIHTNTVEGFFGNLKTGIRGNYKKISRKWLQGYLNEFTFRANQRRENLWGRAMFESLLLRAASVRPSELR